MICRDCLDRWIKFNHRCCGGGTAAVGGEEESFKQLASGKLRDEHYL